VTEVFFDHDSAGTNVSYTAMNPGATRNYRTDKVEAESVHDAEENADGESRKRGALGHPDNPDADHRFPQSGAETRLQQPEIEKENCGIQRLGNEECGECQLQFRSV